jgi:N-acetyl-anhydromuramyl-L-alanine amidase AmpD
MEKVSNGMPDEREDGRDIEEQLSNPDPHPFSREFNDSDLDPALVTPGLEALTSVATLSTINRYLPNEAVPNTKVQLGSLTVTTNNFGNASINISLGNGTYALNVTAPDVSDAPVGPGFPTAPEKPRIWRLFHGEVKITDGKIVAAEPKEFLDISGSRLRIKLSPTWLRAPLSKSRPAAVDMIVVHHTAGSMQGDLNEFLSGNRVSIHYLVSPLGDVLKLVEDSKVASHAGVSHWQGKDGMNSTSIGIEMSHSVGEYPAKQVDAVVNLIKAIQSAFPNIPPNRVIAHSDIGTCDPAHPKSCNPPSPKRLGRKSTDPGSAFKWELVEQLGLGFQIAEGTVKPEMFGNYFTVEPIGKLRTGDNDAAHRFGGKTLLGVQGAIGELQSNLQKLGYYCPPDGDFGKVTAMALQMFQQHIFSGSRRTGSGQSGDGTLDKSTAEMLKRVIGEVGPQLTV